MKKHGRENELAKCMEIAATPRLFTFTQKEEEALLKTALEILDSQKTDLDQLDGALTVLHSLKLHEEAEKQGLEDVAVGALHVKDLENLEQYEAHFAGEEAQELLRRTQGHPALRKLTFLLQ